MTPYDRKAAGERLNAMLSMGMSKPWPNALETLTGTCGMVISPGQIGDSSVLTRSDG